MNGAPARPRPGRYEERPLPSEPSDRALSYCEYSDGLLARFIREAQGTDLFEAESEQEGGAPNTNNDTAGSRTRTCTGVAPQRILSSSSAPTPSHTTE